MSEIRIFVTSTSKSHLNCTIADWTQLNCLSFYSPFRKIVYALQKLCPLSTSLAPPWPWVYKQHRVPNSSRYNVPFKIMFTPRNGSHPKGNKSNPSLYIVHCIKNRPKSSPPVINPQSCGSIRWFRQSNDYHSRMIPTRDKQRNVPGARCTFRTVLIRRRLRSVPVREWLDH